ncbi:MAG: FKBP-type peptidyl-prolyl cis-trans isomerase [Bacteroidaceae bacterium]|nr:FKBP-type peptidyl-prolyl cis-trans isomerase [Bacteroidaceae bacterium]MBR1789625.1 FKBP-type peptidyl-prolyl cis-trans isomerase [Bacteroidaceae bacterium]
MKKSILLIALAVGVCLTASADSKKKKAKKAPAPVVEVVDTIPATDFSYLFGRVNTNGLQQYLTQRMGVDTAYIADFLTGFDQTELTEADKRQKARLAGIEIRQQVMNQIIPQVNKQIDDSLQVLSPELFVAGFRAGISGKDELMPTLSNDTAQQLVQRQMEYYHKAKMERKYGANRRAGEDFLKENAKKPGVVTTPSGLQYKVLTQGTGEIPTATQRVKVNYEGRLIDGTVFDSSYKRNEPTTFGCNQVIKGWTEALTMMPVGSKWELYIPQELAYADRETGQIPPFSMLIFTVELISIEK